VDAINKAFLNSCYYRYQEETLGHIEFEIDVPFYTFMSSQPIQAPQEPILEKPGIKWSWLTLCCVSLASGFLYLVTADITSAIQLTQNPTEQQP
ncbi:MAG: hypothetical protein AAF579_16795, partial [Cyanobacteria bacterium P01_C01_bin.118]